LRQEAHRAGVVLSDTEIQRQVITVAKTTAERGWLREVPSVALVQSVNDARRAFRNFFDSVAGKRKGRQVGPPRFKRRMTSRQSFRLTRNGFRIRPNGRLEIAKIGGVAVRWSRELPSEPSSVTIIREPDGHHYANRDHNAAKNVLAAGRAERLNAGGASVSPPIGEVRGDEAGSTSTAT